MVKRILRKLQIVSTVVNVMLIMRRNLTRCSLVTIVSARCVATVVFLTIPLSAITLAKEVLILTQLPFILCISMKINLCYVSNTMFLIRTWIIEMCLINSMRQ